jgi:hypothetical protein
MTTPDIRTALERLVELDDRKGPAPAIANAWTDAIATARAALAEPVGVGASDDAWWHELVSEIARVQHVAAGEGQGPRFDLAEAVVRWCHPAPPAPEPPTDEQLLESAAKALGYKFIPSDESCLTAEASELLGFARAVLDRWGTPNPITEELK